MEHWTDTYPFVIKPYGHQLTYLKDHALSEEHALLWNMGTGKSKAIIDNIAYLYDVGKINSFVLIALNGVHTNWNLREIPAHMPEHIEYIDVAWGPARTSKKWKKAWDQLCTPSSKLRILTMNVDAMSHASGVKFMNQFIASTGGKVMVAVDESSTIKAPTSGRTKNILKLTKQAKYRRILTGTPVTQSPFDIFTQAEFLKKGLMGFANYYMFTHRYAKFKSMKMGNRHFETVAQYLNLEELNVKIAGFSSFVTKSECMDLPPKVYMQPKTVKLTDQQADLYKEMKEEFCVELQGELITVENALGKLSKLHQIVSGHIITESGATIRLKTNRPLALIEVLSGVSGKAIVWCPWRQGLKDIVEVLTSTYGAETVVEYHGGVSRDDREVAIDSFQDPDSEVRWFVGNQSTAGYGLTLTQAQTEVYYMNSYSLEQRLQSEDRAHRGGQHNPVAYIDLVCEDTVDMNVIEALHNKVDVAKQVTVLLEDWLK